MRTVVAAVLAVLVGVLPVLPPEHVHEDDHHDGAVIHRHAAAHDLAVHAAADDGHAGRNTADAADHDAHHGAHHDAPRDVDHAAGHDAGHAAEHTADHAADREAPALARWHPAHDSTHLDRLHDDETIVLTLDEAYVAPTVDLDVAVAVAPLLAVLEPPAPVLARARDVVGRPIHGPPRVPTGLRAPPPPSRL